jgi:hypothetical protein
MRTDTTAVARFGVTFDYLFTFVRVITESCFWLRHVCPTAWDTSAPIGRIFMKFYVRVLF